MCPDDGENDMEPYGGPAVPQTNPTVEKLKEEEVKKKLGQAATISGTPMTAESLKLLGAGQPYPGSGQ